MSTTVVSMDALPKYGAADGVSCSTPHASAGQYTGGLQDSKNSDEDVRIHNLAMLSVSMADDMVDSNGENRESFSATLW